MTWLRGRPEGRVWALVLWDHSYQPVPEVMQYEPSRNVWLNSSAPGDYRADQCSYSPLPYHERFDAETHLFHQPPKKSAYVPDKCMGRLSATTYCALDRGHPGECQSWKPQE